MESDDGELKPTEFIEGLVRLASNRFLKPAENLATRFIKVMNEEVLPNACSVDTDVFRERLKALVLSAPIAALAGAGFAVERAADRAAVRGEERRRGYAALARFGGAL